MKFWWVRVVGVAAAITMIGGCTSESSDQASSTTLLESGSVAVDVENGDTATLELPGGGRIEVPKGSVRGRGRLVARPIAVADAHGTPEGMTATAPPLDITLEDAELAGPLRIVRDVSTADASTTVQAVYDESSQQWEPEDSSIGDEAGTVVTDVDHLSIRGWFKVDLGWAQEYVKQLLLGSFGDQAAEVEAVVCANDDYPASEGWQVSSSSDDRVTWCLDRSGSSRTLTVRNGARYPVMLNGPDGLDYQRPVLPLAIGSIFVKFEEALFNTTDRTYLLAQRRDDLSVGLKALKAGDQATFRIEANATATTTQFLDLDIQLALQLLAKMPKEFLPKTLRNVKDPAELLDSAELAQCVIGSYRASDLTLDAQRSSDPVEVAGKVSRCVAGEFKRLAPGLAGFLVNTLVATLTLPGDIAGTMVAGGSLVFNDLGEYRITVSRASDAVPGIDAALPTVTVDAGNAQEFQEFLQRFSLLDDGELAQCRGLTVLGVDFASGSADIEDGYGATGADTECGGDSVSTIKQYRNGELIREASACPDCTFDADDPRYYEIIDRYRGRSIPSFFMISDGDVAVIIDYENLTL